MIDEIRITHDENNYDLLICRRMECSFNPSVDGTLSAMILKKPLKKGAFLWLSGFQPIL